MANPGKTYFPDPNDKSVFIFDWVPWLGGAEIVSGNCSIVGPDAAMTIDSVALLNTNTAVQVRALGGSLVSAGSAGYQLTCQVETNESPTRRKEVSVFLKPRNN